MAKSQTTAVICCVCGRYHVLGEQAVEAVCAGLAAAGVSYERVDDLCGLAAWQDARLLAMGRAEKVCVVGCEARAVRWLLHRAGVEVKGDRVEVFNLKEQRPEAVVAAIQEKCKGQDAEWSLEEAGKMPATEDKADWVPWFPVIDYEVCSGCKSCLNFCLFGVFGVSEGGEVVVERPERCKTNCPACARVCPTGAIMFPKHPQASINGGAGEVDGEGQEAVRVDVKSVLGNDVYAALRRRGGKAEGGRRFAPAAGGMAEMERLQGELGIPEEVIRAMCKEEIAAFLSRQKRLEQEPEKESGECTCKREARRAAEQADQEGDEEERSEGTGGCSCGG